MVLTIQQDEFQLMKRVVLDKDKEEALRLIKQLGGPFGTTEQPGFEIPSGSVKRMWMKELPVKSRVFPKRRTNINPMLIDFDPLQTRGYGLLLMIYQNHRLSPGG